MTDSRPRCRGPLTVQPLDRSLEASAGRDGHGLSRRGLLMKRLRGPEGVIAHRACAPRSRPGDQAQLLQHPHTVVETDFFDDLAVFEF